MYAPQAQFITVSGKYLLNTKVGDHLGKFLVKQLLVKRTSPSAVPKEYFLNQNSKREFVLKTKGAL